MDRTVLDAIAMVGFPIVMCLLLFWQSCKVIGKMTTVIEANTQSNVELVTYLKTRGDCK